jgi:hypothetical protein
VQRRCLPAARLLVACSRWCAPLPLTCCPVARLCVHWRRVHFCLVWLFVGYALWLLDQHYKV